MQYSRDELDDGDKTDCDLFKFKSRIINKTGNAGTLNVEITVSLKYFSRFRRILEISLRNCETILDLTSSANCVICEVDGTTTFVITYTKPYI